MSHHNDSNLNTDRFVDAFEPSWFVPSENEPTGITTEEKGAIKYNCNTCKNRPPRIEQENRWKD